jgi:hypothetical protein
LLEILSSRGRDAPFFIVVQALNDRRALINAHGFNDGM